RRPRAAAALSRRAFVMRGIAALALALAIATPATARKPPLVGDTLCVSQSDGPFLALSAEARDAYLTALADAGWRCLRIDFTWSRIQPPPPPSPPDFPRVARRGD